MGDPIGIGPEVCVKILSQGLIACDVALTVIGSLPLLRHTADRMGLSAPLEPVDVPLSEPGRCGVLDLDNFSPDHLPEDPGPTARSGQASVECIEWAVREILDGRADAMITSPISKKAIGLAGSPHPGHTEMLGDLTDTPHPVMLLTNGPLRVAFATTHLPLSDISRALSTEVIAHTGVTLGEALRRYFGVGEPHVVLCALNPHSGDGGRFGDEEERLIQPAIAEIRRQGVDASGPFPSDTLFARVAKGDFDGVVAMYHDQGMIPIKLSGLGVVVNATLDLPIIRTSPGHGTAYDIAGSGNADPASTRAAIRTAARMVRSDRRSAG